MPQPLTPPQPLSKRRDMPLNGQSTDPTRRRYRSRHQTGHPFPYQIQRRCTRNEYVLSTPHPVNSTQMGLSTASTELASQRLSALWARWQSRRQRGKREMTCPGLCSRRVVTAANRLIMPAATNTPMSAGEDTKTQAARCR